MPWISFRPYLVCAPFRATRRWARAVVADIMGQDDIDGYSVETMNRQNIISPGRFALEEGYHRHRRHNGRHDVEVVVQLAQKS